MKLIDPVVGIELGKSTGQQDQDGRVTLDHGGPLRDLLLEWHDPDHGLFQIGPVDRERHIRGLREEALQAGERAITQLVDE